MIAPLSVGALATAMWLHAVALAPVLGECSAAVAVLFAEGLALGAIVLSWPPPGDHRTCGCHRRLNRVAAQLTVAAAVALEVGRLPSPARSALVRAITAYSRTSA